MFRADTVDEGQVLATEASFDRANRWGRTIVPQVVPRQREGIVIDERLEAWHREWVTNQGWRQKGAVATSELKPSLDIPLPTELDRTV